jgi:hypothetical protein
MSEEELRRLLAVHDLPKDLVDLLRDEVVEAYERGKVDEQHRQNKRERDRCDAQRARLTFEDVLVGLVHHAQRRIADIRHSPLVE